MGYNVYKTTRERLKHRLLQRISARHEKSIAETGRQNRKPGAKHRRAG